VTQRTGFLILLAITALIALPLGCRQDAQNTSVAPQQQAAGKPIVRVRILENRDKVSIAASAPLVARAGADRSVSLNLPSGTPVEVWLTPGGWRVGSQVLGTGELRLEPSQDGALSVDGAAYRGIYRLVATGPSKFDVVNDVDVDSYLKGVVAKEMLAGWAPEAYKAQAIVARTYALYEQRTASQNSYWDLYPDVRSQVYGGIAGETAKSRDAVEQTRGVVVAYGPPRQEKIFKAYFSSCCGGITQSAVDAFGFEEQRIEPLFDQNVHGLCAASPRYNWGPVVVSKDELTRRFRIWGARRTTTPGDVASAVRNIGAVTKIEIPSNGLNRFGRPVRFIVTDARGVRYSFSGEELRTAVNADAPKDNTVYSSFFKVINEVDRVRFVEGHGWGHGAGMCQWCAQARAQQGMRHEDIVLAAFQRAKLVKAY
jgi:stage II sporulation protein D